MIVYDLRCEYADHLFEGWFGSSGDFDDQKQRGLLQCPFCGSQKISKAIMAPYVSAKHNSSNAAHISEKDIEGKTMGVVGGSAGKANIPEAVSRHSFEKIAKLQAALLEKSEWVGADFTNRARAIHYGERGAEQIHGFASPSQVNELNEEGISTLPLPLPVIPPEAKN